MPLTRVGPLDPRAGRQCALCRRLLGRPASGSGRLCHGDGTQARGRDPSQGRPPPEGVHVAYPRDELLEALGELPDDDDAPSEVLDLIEAAVSHAEGRGLGIFEVRDLP
jgi:hypothetical protein